VRRLLAFACSLALATACTSGPALKVQPNGPLLQIAGIEIYNGLSYTVQDVVILVPVSGDYVSCGQILPDSSCSTSFPVRDYRENAVQVSWKEQGEPHSMAPFKLEAPTTASEGQQAYIRVEVFAAGQAGAKLILLEGGPL
jgi:hypothetical protein